MAAFRRFVALVLIFPLLFFGTPPVAWGAKEEKKPHAPERLDYQQYTDTQNNVAIDAYVMRGREGVLKTEFISRPPGLGRLKIAQLISPEGVVYTPEETFDISEQAARNLGRLRPVAVPIETERPKKKKSKLGALAVGTAVTALSSLASGRRVTTTVGEAGHEVARETTGVSPSATGIVAGLAPALVATQAGGKAPQEGVRWVEPQTAGTGHFSSVAEFKDPPPTESQAPWLLKVTMEMPDGTILTFTYYLNPLHFISGPPVIVTVEEEKPPTEEKDKPPGEEEEKPPKEEEKPPEEEEKPPEEEEKPPEEEEEEEPPVRTGGLVSVPREGPGTVPPEEPKVPPEGPTVPPEEPPIITLTPEEPLLCCDKVGSQILFPVTKDPLSPPKTQEAWQNSAVGAHNVFLHDGSFFQQEHDLFVESAGIDFDWVRTYRSNIRTEAGGLFGHKWDLNLNKRIVPQGGVLTSAGIKAEPATHPGSQLYFNGAGRADLFTHRHSEERLVKNFHQEFRAFVSTYQAPAGLFAELERYVVLPGFSMPFSEHPNVEGRIFYVLRFKDGYREIFNCRGQVIYVQDRHENTMTLIYSPPLHPLTMNPILSRVVDTAGREYTLEYVPIETGPVETFYQGRVIRTTEPMMRLKSVTDFERRKVEYRYQGFDTVPELEESTGQMDSLHMITRFTYEGDHLLSTITNPREMQIGRGQGGEPYLTNRWEGDKVVSQQVGRSPMATVTRQEGTVGGEWKIRSGEQAEVTDRGNRVSRYTLKKISDSHVIKQMEEPLDDETFAVTTYKHNDDYQITQITRPEGNQVVYEYDPTNETVTQGDVRDWFDRGVTYENNLSKGSLTTKKLLAGQKRNELPYSKIVIRYEYEPLFNQVSRIEGPGRAVTDYRYDHGWYAAPGNNGNPLEETHPQRTRSEGEALRNIRTVYTYKPQGMVETITDPLQHVTTFTYEDRTGYLLGIQSPDGNLGFGRDGRGNVTRFTDPRGTVTRYEVNQRGLITREIADESGFQNEIRYQYDYNGNLTEARKLIQDNLPDGPEFRQIPGARRDYWVTTYEYNLLNRLTRETQRIGDLERKFAYAYDMNENIVRLTSPEAMAARDVNHYVEMEYDARDLLKKKLIGGQHVRKVVENYEYDKNGNVISKAVGDRTEKTLYETDGFDRPFKTTTPLGTVIKEFLNPSGTLEHIEARGKNHEGDEVDLLYTEFLYDEFNSVIRTNERILDPAGRHRQTRTVQYVRDEEGKVGKILDPEGNATLIDFTPTIHRKGKETDPLGNETVYAYDPDGLVSSITQNEREKRYVLDERGREPSPRETSASYVIRMEYDALGRLRALTDPGQHTTFYGYDSADHLRAIIYPGGRRDLFEQDGLGRTIRETQFANLREGALVTSKAYDLNDRLISLESRRDGTPLLSLAYEYYPTDRIHRLTQNGQVYRYGYDAAGNLETEIMPNRIRVGRDYDAEDRLTQVRVQYADTVWQTGSSRDTFEYDGMGRLTQAERYRGFVVNQLSHNSLGLPVTDTQTVAGQSFTVTYEYNRRGLREQMIVPALPGVRSQTFHYAYDALGRLREVENLSSRDRRSELAYDYSGTSRLARRRLGVAEHTLYEYGSERELTGLEVFNFLDGQVNWQSRMTYAGPHEPQSFSSQFEFPDHPTTQVTVQEDTPFGALAKTNVTEISHQRGSDIHLAASTRRLNRYEAGRLSRVFNYFETFQDAPGRIYGRNVSSTVRGEKINYVYDGPQIRQTEFHRFGSLEPGLLDLVSNFVQHGFSSFHHYLDAGLRDEAIEEAMSGRGEVVQINPFEHDANGNLVQDDRFYYKFDYRDRLSQVVDKYNFGRGFNEECRYFYDYLNRPVYTQHGPAGQGEVRRWRANTRILYDGKLPYAEVRTDFSGVPNAVDALYVTHPEGADIGRMFLRVRPGTHLEEFHPFFNGEGALVYLSDRLGHPQKMAYEFEAPNRRAKLKHRVAGRAQNSRVEIPLTSLATRWEAFPELSLYIPDGQFIFDYSRNLDQEWLDIVDAANQALHEQIAAFQKEALILLGIGFLPFLLASPWVIVFAFADVVIDYGISVVLLGGEYSLSDAVLAFEMGAPLAAFGLEMKAMQELVRTTVARSVLSRQGGRTIKEALKKAASEVDEEVSELVLKKKQLLPDWALRRDEWDRIASVPANRAYLRRKILGYLKESADRGNRWAQDLYDDILAGRISVHFRPEITSRGFFRRGTNVLNLNPFRTSAMKMRNLKELTSTLLHEYLHYRGFNELGVHFEQYLFLFQLAARRSLSRFPQMGKDLGEFMAALRTQGLDSAKDFIQRHVMGRYKEAYSPAKLVKSIATYKGGRYTEVERLLNLLKREDLWNSVDQAKLA